MAFVAGQEEEEEVADWSFNCYFSGSMCNSVRYKFLRFFSCLIHSFLAVFNYEIVTYFSQDTFFKSSNFLVRVIKCCICNCGQV